MIDRRSLFAALLLASTVSCSSAASEADAWEALEEVGTIVLFRHALAPGGGDPPDMRLDDCSTQRNLNEAGREQARRIGEAFRARGIEVGAVLTSQWCRSRETAELAFPGLVVEEVAFNTFFGSRRSDEVARTSAARAVFNTWQGPGILFVSTHFVNIHALTGIGPASGEGVVLRRSGDDWLVVGRITP